MQDYTILGEKLKFPVNYDYMNGNNNEIIIGSTGVGKTTSIVEPRLLYTYNTSLVVPLTKRCLVDRYKKIFEERGYKVYDLDFSNPETSESCFDPFDYLDNNKDITEVMEGLTSESTRDTDKYWENAATSLLTGEAALVKENNKDASILDFFRLHKSLRLAGDETKKQITNLDFLFERALDINPGSFAHSAWKTIMVNSSKTASCVYSVANSSVDKLLSPEVIQFFEKTNKIDLRKLGNEKSIVFVTSSSTSNAMRNLINIFYSILFKVLLKEAEKREDKQLKIPVHIVFDDFACGSTIKNFASYISFFRALRISVTLLLQSETQLEAMYGRADAATILNNAATHVYMANIDYKTQESIACKMNKPVEEIMASGIEDIYVFRMGCKPQKTKRYQLYKDDSYIKEFGITA